MLLVNFSLRLHVSIHPLMHNDELKLSTPANRSRPPEEFQFLGLGCDVSSEASIHSAYKTTMEKFGRLDSVVASAGIVENFPAVE